MQHYPHDIHTHMQNVYRENHRWPVPAFEHECLQEVDPGMVIADLWPLYPIKGYDGLTEEMLCPPSM